MLAETEANSELDVALKRVAELDEALAGATATLAITKKALSTITAERDKLRHAYQRLLEQMELLRRRIFVAKAERIDTQQLELEFADVARKLAKLTTELTASAEAAEAGGGDDDSPESAPPPAPTKKKPSGRRDLRTLDLPEERVELLDPVLESTAERIGFEESCTLGYRRGGAIRIVTARATYKVTKKNESDAFVTVETPKSLYDRGILAPSFIAHLLIKKFR